MNTNGVSKKPKTDMHISHVKAMRYNCINKDFQVDKEPAAAHISPWRLSRRRSRP